MADDYTAARAAQAAHRASLYAALLGHSTTVERDAGEADAEAPTPPRESEAQTIRRALGRE